MATRPTKAGAEPKRKAAKPAPKPIGPSRAAGRALEGLTEQMETLTGSLDALTRRFDEFSRKVLDELRDRRDAARGSDRGIDPGDAVPPGVAPLTPAPLTDQDRKVLDKLEHDFPSKA